MDVGDDESPPPMLNPHNIHWYLAMRAVERFHDANGRVPGVNDNQVEEVCTILMDCMIRTFVACGIR